MTKNNDNLSVVLQCLALVLLTINCPTASQAFEVQGASDTIATLDASDNPQVYFKPGDRIRYEINYDLEGPLSLVLTGGIVRSDDFTEALPWQYGILPAGSYRTVWDSTLPGDARGIATVSIYYIGVIDRTSVREKTFSITPAAGTPEVVGSQICAACHGQIASALKDSAHGFIECETCHGPASLHTSAPSPETITIDRTSAFCGTCHTRRDTQHRVEAEDGLIKRNQQFDELLTGGKASFKCVRCHNPHVSIDRDPQQAIKVDCTDCHDQTLNQVHVAAGIRCIDCHMPFAVRREAASGSGDYLKGDGRAHLFSISTTPLPSEMFYTEDGTTFTNGFLTLNFVCLGCHDGSFALERSFDWAVQASGLIH